MRAGFLLSLEFDRRRQRSSADLISYLTESRTQWRVLKSYIKSLHGKYRLSRTYAPSTPGGSSTPPTHISRVSAGQAQSASCEYTRILGILDTGMKRFLIREIRMILLLHATTT